MAVAIYAASCSVASSSPLPRATGSVGLQASKLGLDLDTLPVMGPPQGRLAIEDTASPDTAAGDVAIAPPPAVFDAPPAPPPPPPTPLRDPFAGVTPAAGTWAVMIGINDYPGTGHDLRSAVNDADDVNEALARLGVPGDHRLLITDRQATAGVVRLAADWLVAHASPDAVAVFFYAGHVRKVSSSTEAIVSSDGDVVTDADLAGHLAKLQAKRTWLGIAACYGGGFTELLGPGRALTAAAGANSLAYENESFGRSYMVEYMVRQGIIEGRSSPTVQASVAYAQAAIHRDYPGREPVEVEDQAPVIDFRAPPAPQPPSKQPPSSPPPSSPPPSGAGGSSGGGGGGGGSGSDGCTQLTLGVVSCR